MAERFQNQLIKLLQQKYEGHWHPKDRRLGSAYRTISYDHRIDPILVQASENAGIKNIERLLESSRYIMFVNPGEVKIKNVSNADTFWDADVETIWRKAPQPDEKVESAASPQSNGNGVSNGSASPSEASTSPTLSPEPSPPGSPKHTGSNGAAGSNGTRRESPSTMRRNLSSKLQPGAAPFVPSPNPSGDPKQDSKSVFSPPVPQGSPTAAQSGGSGSVPQVTILPRPANAQRAGQAQISVQLVRNS